ncbi:uncharacterized protein BKA78DRAFT_293511 [Phyllosticta capitalensis]|uniref:uncharacterized protein n=1 Tax=Phyllosticta capitalensis TaxID=121624 RepID=UPI003131A4B7
MTSMGDTEQRLQANFAAAQEELRRFQETKEVSKRVAEIMKDVKTEEELERLLQIIANHATAKGLSLEVFGKVAGEHGKPVEGSEPTKQGAKPGKKGAKLVENKGPMTPVKKTGTLKSEEKSVKALHLAARQARPPPPSAPGGISSSPLYNLYSRGRQGLAKRHAVDEDTSSPRKKRKNNQ